MSGSSPLTLAQLDQLLAAITNPRDQAALLLSCGCGLRAGTLTKLKLSAVLDSDHRLTGRVEIPRRNMKGKHQAHRVDIPERALRALGTWIAVHPSPHRQAPLWPSHRNKEEPITTRQWRRIIQAAARAADIAARISPHSARKFFAHAIYEGTNHDIQLTTRALGNRSPMATMHYLDFGQRRITSATLDIFNAQAHGDLLLNTPEAKSST